MCESVSLKLLMTALNNLLFSDSRSGQTFPTDARVSVSGVTGLWQTFPTDAQRSAFRCPGVLLSVSQGLGFVDG